MLKIKIIKQFYSIKKSIPEGFEFQFTNSEFEEESKEYWACRFEVNNLKVIYRKAKITPTKVGQFVTLWKRVPQGVIVPFHSNDNFDLVIIYVERDNEFGQFIFSKSVLINKGIVSNKIKEGKRGFRIYPPWDEAKNKQAKKTQEWQLEHFLSPKNNSINVVKAKELFNLNDD